jgi:hypothetical protein
LTDGVDIRTGDVIRTSDVIFEIDFVTEIHPARDGGEDQSFLSTIRKRKFDLAIQSTGSKQRWIECVRSVRRHDHLDVRALIESIHLIEEFEKNALHFAISYSIPISTPNERRRKTTHRLFEHRNALSRWHRFHR